MLDQNRIKRIWIEVAFFISIFYEVAVTVEEKRKGKTPKEETCCMFLSWACC